MQIPIYQAAHSKTKSVTHKGSRENRLSFFYADKQKGVTTYDETRRKTGSIRNFNKLSRFHQIDGSSQFPLKSLYSLKIEILSYNDPCHNLWYKTTKKTLCFHKISFLGIRQPSTLPGSSPPSTIDRLGLNRRVRNGNGCVP